LILSTGHKTSTPEEMEEDPAGGNGSGCFAAAGIQASAAV